MSKEITIKEANTSQYGCLAKKLQLVGLNLPSLSGAFNSKLGYKTISASSIIDPVRKALNEFGVVTITGIFNSKEDIVTGGFGKNRAVQDGHMVSGNISVKFINADDKEDMIETTWAYVGYDRDDPCKAFGKALTYAQKYLYRSVFNLCNDEDDVDSGSSNAYGGSGYVPPVPSAPVLASNEELTQLISLAKTKGNMDEPTLLAQINSQYQKTYGQLSMVEKVITIQLTTMLKGM